MKARASPRAGVGYQISTGPDKLAPAKRTPCPLRGHSSFGLGARLKPLFDQQALGLGDLDLALAYAESALRSADSFDSNEAQMMVDSESLLIDHIFETRIGSMQQRVNVVGVPSNLDTKVSPEQAFLISRLDGGVTVEEVLDLSPMQRRDTLRLLLALLRDGLVAFGDGRPSEKHRLE